MAEDRSMPKRLRSTVTRMGAASWHWSDTYHTVLRLSWPRFFLLVICIYLSVNLVFALLYAAVPGTIVNARSGSFVDLFFFSVETLATVGYGVMSPGSIYGHIVASTEIVLGMLVTAVMAGLMFARNMVVTTFNGVPTLMVRVANERNNLILEASVRLTLVRRERTLEGDVFYRVYDLKLERDRSSAFALSWTIMHRIDATSPLHDKTGEDLLLDDAEFYVAISGQDETLNDTVSARKLYEPGDILFGSRYDDILFERESGNWSVDFSKFHDVKPDRH